MRLHNNTTNDIYQSAKVVSVIDGDTVKVNLDGKVEKIRFIGMNCPEIKHGNNPAQFYGVEAANYTRKKLSNKTIYLQKDVSDRDKYGRLLRYIWLEKPSSDNPKKEEIASNCYNAILVKNGYARVRKYPPDVKYNEILEQLESQPKNNKIGLWQNSNERHLPQRKSKLKENGLIKGNKRSKVHHLPGQENYDNISDKNVLYFNSEREAQQAGYRPARR